MTTEQTPKAHLGRNVRHFRQEKDLSQEAFADLLGAPWSQKKISQLENNADIDAAVLEDIARALEISVEEIKNFSEFPVVNNNQYNYEGSQNVGANGPSGPYSGGHFTNCAINPLDKLMESYDRLADAYEKIEKLNDALLKEKDDKIALLERMLNKTK